MQQHSKYGRTAPAVTVSMQQLNSSWLLPCPCLPVRRQLFSSRPRPAPAAPPIPHWTQQSRPEVPPHLEHTVHRCPASSADAFSSPQPVPDDEPPVLSTIFPRVRERDPYRRLGVAQDAPFEEVQDAHNYLWQAYRSHEASRESIELALDSILQQRYSTRNKIGYRPPKATNRRLAGPEAAPRLTVKERIQSLLEPSVPRTTIVNEGAIFFALGLWAALQAGTADPSLPIVGSFGYSIWVYVKKRKNRNPDGPFWGNNPLWGALATTLIVLLTCTLFCSALVSRLPLPRSVHPQAALLFLINLSVGAACIWVK